MPTGVPETITPNCEKIPLAKLKHDIGKLTAKFDKITEIWWENFFKDLESLTTRKETWFLEQMKKVEEGLSVQQTDVTDEEMQVRNQIDTLIEKETVETEVLYMFPLYTSISSFFVSLKNRFLCILHEFKKTFLKYRLFCFIKQ